MFFAREVKHFVARRARSRIMSSVVNALDDGDYDALIIDATADDDARDVTHLELAITAGARKGDVVRVRASRLDRDVIDLLGLPVTLIVRDGAPEVRIS